MSLDPKSAPARLWRHLVVWFTLKLTVVAFEEKKLHRRRTSFVPGAVCPTDPAPYARPVPAATGGIALAYCVRPWATPLARTLANSWTLELRPLRPSLPAGPLPRQPLPYSPRWLRLPESPRAARRLEREGVKEGAGSRAGGALKFPARCAPTAAGRWRPGHAGAQGGSMKGSDRAYTRGPSLRWLFAKCCCCFPCGGEWLSALAPSLSQRLGGLSARERRGKRGG